jgi:hypothetical protein
LNKKAHSDAPGDSFLARPRRCGVPKMRYNEFGKHTTPNLFYQYPHFTCWEIILVIEPFFFPVEYFEKVGDKNDNIP